MKIRSVGAEVFRGCGQGDRCDETNASKNGPWRIKDVTGLGNNPIKVLELGALQYGISLAEGRIVLFNNAVSCRQYTRIAPVINEYK